MPPSDSALFHGENPEETAFRDLPMSKSDLQAGACGFAEGYALRFDPGADGVDDKAVFQGDMKVRRLPGGATVWSSRLHALETCEQECCAPRGICLVQMMECLPRNPAVLAISGRDVTMGAGESILLRFPDDLTSLKGRYVKGETRAALVLQLPLEDLGEEAMAEAVNCLSREGGACSLGCDVALAALGRELYRLDHAGIVGAFLRESLVESLFADVLRLCDVPGPYSWCESRISRGDRLKMARVYDLLLDRPGHPHTLGELARNAGVSTSTLKTKFREIYGKTVFSLLCDIRLERARAGLERENWSVSQAAYFAGYRHPGNFSTAFRRHFGYAPSLR